MPQVRAVVFDLGHTVWDFLPTEQSRRLGILRLHERLLRDHAGAPSPGDLDRVLGTTAQRWFRTWDERSDGFVQPPSDQFVREILEATGLHAQDDLLCELTAILFGRELDMPIVEPDTLAALAALHHRGLLMGCVTNTILLDAAIADVLYRLGLTRYFSTVVVSSDGGYRKPHPSFFQRALDDLGVAPQDTVFVGDRLFDDVGGAQAVGMRAVLTHQYRQEELDGAPVPDATVQRLSELPRVVDDLDARP